MGRCPSDPRWSPGGIGARFNYRQRELPQVAPILLVGGRHVPLGERSARLRSLPRREASASGTVARERDKGTLAALLAQPLRRSEIFLGKYFVKLLVFLAISTSIVVAMIGISTVVLGPQLYLVWAPVVILDLTMVFAFYAAYAQFLSCFFRRSRSVFSVIVLTWFLLLGLMEYAASQRVNLLPYAYFVPINSATLAFAGTRAYFANPNGTVAVSPLPGASSGGTLPLLGFNPLSFGNDTTFQFAVMATTGLVLGTILFLVLGWWAFRRIQIKG